MIVKHHSLILKASLSKRNIISKALKNSILTVRPNILVVEGEVSRKIVEKIRDMGISLIMNIPIEDLKMLAWMTQTVILPSFDFIDENFKWGTCGEFIVQSQLDDNQYSKSTSHYKTKYNAFFLNCNPALGCTLSITGPIEEELEDVKKCIIAILDACREELLGNGFEKRDYSIVSKTRVHYNEDISLRHKTMMYDRFKSAQFSLREVNDIERGGFVNNIPM